MSNEANETEKQLRDAQDALSVMIRDTYNRMATTYESHLMDDCQYTLPAKVAKLMGPMAQGRKDFLELAVGPGNIGKAIADEGIDIRITAGDFAIDMLKVIECPLYTGRVLMEATHPFPFKDNSFDGAFFILLMEHVTDPLLVFRELFPVIKPGGLVLFTFMISESDNVEMLEHDSTLIAHPRDLVMNELASAGFSLLKEFPLDAYIHDGKWRKHNLTLAIKG